jgi:hypothetical protein
MYYSVRVRFLTIVAGSITVSMATGQRLAVSSVPPSCLTLPSLALRREAHRSVSLTTETLLAHIFLLFSVGREPSAPYMADEGRGRANIYCM